MKATPGALVIAALAALPACDAERLLAIARSGGTGGSAGSDAGQGTPFGPPQIVTGLRGDTEDVQDPSLTFEGLELYFASPTGGQNDIWVSRRTVATDAWGPSTLVSELSSPANDQDPEVSVDGLVMYFASDRGGSMRLYAAQRRTRDTPWAMTTLVDSLGASTADQAPGLDRSQLDLVFASERGATGRLHLFTTTRADASAAWPGPSEITALSSSWDDGDPALFADGSQLVFASRRLTQGGTADLFQAARQNPTSPFASLAPRTELNTAHTEEDPWMSQDGRHILFVSDRSGASRIYEAWR